MFCGLKFHDVYISIITAILHIDTTITAPGSICYFVIRCHGDTDIQVENAIYYFWSLIQNSYISLKARTKIILQL